MTQVITLRRAAIESRITRRTIDDFSAGDTVRVDAYIGPADRNSVPVSRAWLTVKARLGDADPGLFQIEGEVLIPGTATAEALCRFVLTGAQSAQLETWHHYDVQLFLADGAMVTVFPGTVRGARGVTDISSGLPPAPVLASIVVTPDPASVQEGATQQFTATGYDAGGSVVPITPVWSVVDAARGTVTQAGLFTAVSAGAVTQVRATVGAVVGDADVTVTSPPPPASSDIIDTFTRANGPVGNTETGQPWVARYGGTLAAWDILNNNLRRIEGTTGILIVAAEFSDGYVEAVVGDPVGLGTRVVARCDASGDCIMWSADGANTAIHKFEAGGYLTLGSHATAVQPGDTIRLEFEGSTLRGYVNGALLVTATSTFHQAALEHGVSVYDGAGTQWASFRAGPLP